MITERFFQCLQQAVVDSESQNPHSHSSEVLFAEKVAKYPQVLKLRYRRMQRILRLVGAYDGVVLDIGAGKGLSVVLAVMAGAREVYAVEMESQRVRSAEGLLDHLDKLSSFGFSKRVHLLQADVLELNLRHGQFAAAYSSELLEHVADPLRLHRKTYVWLKPGGRVYHRTGANGANPLKVRSYSNYWDRADTMVLAPLRREIVQSLAGGSLSPRGLDRIVAETRGLTSIEITQAVELWRKSGSTYGIKRLAKRVPRHPITGEYFERPIHPKEALNELESAGFSAQLVRPDFTNIFVTGMSTLDICRIIGWLINVTHPFSLPVAPWIEVLGTKPK